MAGAGLWRKLAADGELEFDPPDLVTLELACRQQDSIAQLETLEAGQGLLVLGSKGQPKLSPIPAELRLQRAALARLVGLLAIPAAGEVEGKSPTQRRAQKAADARWSRQAHERDRRNHG